MYTLATRAPVATDRAARRSDRCSRLASIGRGPLSREPGIAGDGSRTGDRCSRTLEVKTRHKMTSTFKKNKRALIAGRGSLGPYVLHWHPGGGPGRFNAKIRTKKKPAQGGLDPLGRSVKTLAANRRRWKRNARPYRKHNRARNRATDHHAPR